MGAVGCAGGGGGVHIGEARGGATKNTPMRTPALHTRVPEFGILIIHPELTVALVGILIIHPEMTVALVKSRRRVRTQLLLPPFKSAPASSRVLARGDEGALERHVARAITSRS